MVTSRIWLTAAQKAELWERWKNGQSAAAISRARGARHPPIAPPLRLRATLERSPEEWRGPGSLFAPGFSSYSRVR